MTGPEEPAAEATAAAPATSATSELHERALAHGVATSYVDGTGVERVPSDATLTAIVDALDVGAELALSPVRYTVTGLAGDVFAPWSVRPTASLGVLGLGLGLPGLAYFHTCFPVARSRQRITS